MVRCRALYTLHRGYCLLTDYNSVSQLISEGNAQNIEGAKKLFKKVTGTASMILLADIDDEDLSSFPFPNPQSVFAVLDIHYGGNTAQDKADAFGRLMRIRQGNKSVDEYLLEFEQLAAMLNLGVGIKIAAFLAGLNFATRAVMGTHDPVTWKDAVKGARRAEELKPRTTARSSNGRGGHKNQRGRGAREDIVCYGCQETGHIARDCPNKKDNGSRGRGR